MDRWRKFIQPAYVIAIVGLFCQPASAGSGFDDSGRPKIHFSCISTDPAEYHFQLAAAYEFIGAYDKAHLHYEIVHDCYPCSSRIEEATRRMTMLRNEPRPRIPGLWSGVTPPELTETPSLNGRTQLTIDRIWPVEKEKDIVIYVQEAKTSVIPPQFQFDPRLLANVPFKEGGFQFLDLPLFESSNSDASGSEFE